METTRPVWYGFVGFVTGVGALGLLMWTFPGGVLAPITRDPAASPPPDSTRVEVRPADTEHPPPVDRPADPAAVEMISADPLSDLRSRRLLLPLAVVSAKDLQDTFHDRRGASREHEALDILAPRNTPIRAVEDGTIAKLFTSKAGGITIYQFDPTETYVYYYAHLERYAPGLAEGAVVTRGQHLGDVGTSGNAPPNTPHLHFAVFKLTADRRWWEGAPLDPFEIWR